jgi:hypothetical protein
MSVEPPRAGQVFEKSGVVMSSPRASGRQDQWRRVIPRRRGRPPDDRVARWVARIEGPEFQDSDSRRAKCRALVWAEYLENGGHPDELTEGELVRLAEARRVALSRWYKKHR